MAKENISQEFRLKNRDERRIDFIEKIEQNEFMSKKAQKVLSTLNYVEQFLIFGAIVIRCILVSAFASLVGIPIGITGSVIRLKIYAITAGLKSIGQ